MSVVDDMADHLRVCIVIKVDADRLISRIDEYFDPKDLAPLPD